MWLAGDHDVIHDDQQAMGQRGNGFVRWHAPDPPAIERSQEGRFGMTRRPGGQDERGPLRRIAPADARPPAFAAAFVLTGG